MKTPEQLAWEWINDLPSLDLNGVKRTAARLLAALLRQRDAEHEALRREERGRAFDAGVTAGLEFAPYDLKADYIDIVDRRLAAARRAAVEGEEGGET